jgi:hypothetical protein
MNPLRNFKNNINHSLFLINGKNPWSRGYNIYKERQIKYILERENFNTSLLEENYGLRLDERIVEYPWLFSQLPSHGGNLLDAGSALNHGFLLSQKSLSSKHIFISTLVPEAGCFWHKNISYVYEDLRETCYRDNFFDWVVCISTLEHIGLDNTMLYTSDELKNESSPNSYLEAIREYYRILKSGGTLFLTFPFGKHVNHGWFQIFNHEMLDAVIDTFNPTSVIEFHYRYESSGWQVSSRESSKDATYFDINKQKNYDADYAAASRAIVCLKMVK